MLDPLSVVLGAALVLVILAGMYAIRARHRSIESYNRRRERYEQMMREKRGP